MSINEITKNHIEYRHWQNEEDYQLFDSLGALNGQNYRVNNLITANQAKTWLSAQEHFDPNKMIMIVENQQQPIAILTYYPIKTETNQWIFRIWLSVKPEWTRSSEIAKAFVLLEEAITQQAKTMQCQSVRMECVYHDTEKWRQQLLESRDFSSKEYHFELSSTIGDSLEKVELPTGLTIKPADCLEKELKCIEFSFQSIKNLTGYDIKNQKMINAMRMQEHYNPFLWKIIWDRENIVGVASNYIDEHESLLLERKRAHIDKISCHPKYKNTNLTKKLFAETLQMFKEMGVEEVIYDVDILNEEEELTIAESFGFQAKKYIVLMKKEIEQI